MLIACSMVTSIVPGTANAINVHAWLSIDQVKLMLSPVIN